ncbi:MAG: LamG-like jellyroll fold domain-containing protein, partial [Armatimonadota bacterium]
MSRAAMVLALLPAVCRAQEPLLVAPFDGSDEATLNLGAPAQISGFASMGGPYVPGLVGQARELGGLNQLSYFLNEGFFPLRGTLSMWVRPQDWTPARARHFVFFARLALADLERGYVRLILYKLWDTDEIALLVQNTPVTDRSTLIRVAAPDWEEGQWHHLAVTWDAERYRLFVDGEAAGESPAIALPAQGRWELAIGTAYPGWAYLGDEKTAIDEFAIWPEPLSAEQIRTQHEATLAAAPPEAFELPAPTGLPPVEGNLALADEGAWVLASSFADYEAHYPDNLIDGRETSVWAPLTAELPQWLEVRWRLPRIVTGVVLRPPAPGRLRAFSAAAWSWVDGAWRSPGRFEGIGPDATEVSLPIEETLTDRVRVTIEAGGPEPVELSTLAVTGPEQPVLERMPVSGRERVQVELRRVRVTPERARPGEWVQIEATISPRAPLSEDLVFALEMGETPLTPGWSDLFVAGRAVGLDGPLDEWVPGSEHSLTAGLRLPDWAPAGALQVYLRGRGSKGSTLEVLDAAGQAADAIATLIVERPAAEERAGVPGAALDFSGGRARWVLGEKVVPPMAWAMSMPSWQRYYLYSSTGVHVHTAKTLPLNFDDAPGHFQRVCAQLDERITHALRVDPNALFIVNPDLRPRDEWLERNPGERLVTAQGALGPVCFSSAKYTEGVHDFLRRLVR